MAIEPNPLQEDENRTRAVTAPHTKTEIFGDGRSNSDRSRIGQGGQSVWTLLSKHQRRLNGVHRDRFWDEQGLLWIGFSFAAGIAVYALIPQEPYWPVLSCLFGLLCVLAVRMGRTHALGKVLLLALAVLGGVTAGSLRTAYVAAPKLGEAMNVNLTGFVAGRQVNSSGTRLILQVLSVNGYPRSAVVFPERVRVRVPVDPQIAIGEKIRLRGRLFPPAGPVAPGGYDFSFRAFFAQIGATGFSFGSPVIIEGGDPPLKIRIAAQVQGLRDAIGARIRSALGDGSESALAVALLVGNRSGISEDQEADLRAAGLAHILAISGLHMALFAGGTFGLVLVTLAAIPPLPLRWPTHKWAALAALVAAFIYLLLSGGSVATQRSFLMISLVFLGVLVGRRGLTLRSVALAGIFLLLIAPERLFSPGFQMSFAAVICLIAVYELWRTRETSFKKVRRVQSGGMIRLLQVVGKWAIGLVVTAFVAGLATGIIGAHHFGRIAPFGLLGNLLGMPIFTIVVMPMGVLALVLMPVGLSALPLTIMSWGIHWLLKAATFTAELGADVGAVGNLSAIAALLLICALFSGLLLPRYYRLCAVVPLIGGLVMVWMHRPPDVQISASGTKVATRDADGLLRWSGGRRSFGSDVWLVNEGVSESAILSRKMKSPQRMCDTEGCVVQAFPETGKTGKSSVDVNPLAIALPKTAEALAMDCRFADIVVTDLIAPVGCGAAIVIDTSIRKDRGAVSIWASERGRAGPEAVEAEIDKNQPNYLANATVTKIHYAIPDPPRPWHLPGTVTRSSLKPSRRADQ